MTNKILFQLVFAIVATLSLASCDLATKQENEPPPSPEVLKAQLHEQEEDNPGQYLSVTGTMTENRVKVRDAGLFRDAEYETDGYTVYCTVQNTATVARFKDLHVTIKFYSKTKTVLDTQEFVQYEFFEPNSTSDFTLLLYPPDEMAEWSIDVSGATAVQ